MTAQIGAVHPGHVYIRDKKIYYSWILPRPFQPFAPIGSGNHEIPLMLQEQSDEIANQRFVVSNKNHGLVDP
jgi:hypothetical protein